MNFISNLKIGSKALCLTALLLCTKVVSAQAPTDSEFYSVATRSSGAPEATSDWSFQIGALLIDWPEYDGADSNESRAFPLFTIEFQNRYFIDTIEGIGIHLVTNKPYTLDASILADFGRAESDSMQLAGLGDVDAGAAFKLKAGYRHQSFSYSASVEQSVSGNGTGYWVDIEAGYTRVFGGNLILSPALIARYGSADYVQQYYGIGATQSSNSGLAVHSTAAGFVSAGPQLTVARMLHGGWALQGQFKWQRILGDAAESPIVLDEEQLTLAFGVVHTVRYQ